MKIVHISRQFWPAAGGLEEFIERLALEQLARGDSVAIVTLDEIYTRRGVKLPARESYKGLDILRTPFVGSQRYPLAPGVLKYLRGADLVHVHAVDFFFDFIALTRGLRRKTPIVATTHGGFFHTAAHSTLKRIWFNSVTRVSARRYDALVACSASDAAMFRTISPHNLRLIENGVDIDKFADRASVTPAKSLITIGRLSENKRLDRLLDAMAQLVAQDGAWRLAIVGIESDWSAQRLRQEIAARGLDAAVTFHGGLDSAGVAEIVSRASLFASASEYEGFGIALLEAMSAGLLPVVHGNAAYRGFAARYDSVRLADFADAAAAAVAIRRAYEELVAKPALRGAAQDVARQYAWPQVARHYFDVYEQARNA